MVGQASLKDGELRPLAVGNDSQGTHRTMQCNMSDFLRQCVARYQEFGGPMAQKLKKVPTPYIDEAPEPSSLIEPGEEQSPLKAEPRGELPLWHLGSS